MVYQPREGCGLFVLQSNKRKSRDRFELDRTAEKGRTRGIGKRNTDRPYASSTSQLCFPISDFIVAKYS